MPKTSALPFKLRMICWTWRIEAVIGKKTGHDAETGKRTFVTYLGIDGAREKLQDYTAHAVASIDVFGEKGFFLRNMAEYLLSRTK